eukprot:INCI17541.6.p1 GENE.INCI17541.6~~INCI17541.6.p1  ORF type:complete len:457 (-),score=62.94 INCI17541.6:563-1933(-)
MATIASTRRRRSRRLSAQSAATAAPADEAAPVPTTRTKRKALGAIPNNNNEDAAAPKKIGKKTTKSSSSSSDKTGAAVAKAQPKTKTKPAKAKSKSTQKTKKTAASKSVAEGVTSTAENKSGAQAKSEDAGQPANPVATAASLAQIRLTHELHYVNELDRGKPLACFEYAQEIHRNNLIHESQSPRNCSYLATVQNLTLTPKVRGILIDWLVEVALEFEFQDETLYLSVALVDQALSKFRVKKAKLQLLGCACMLLASKYEEVVTRSVEDFVYVSDRAYSNSEICDVSVARASARSCELAATSVLLFCSDSGNLFSQMELKICTALGFSLTFPTQLSFLTRFLHVRGVGCAEIVVHNCAYLGLHSASRTHSSLNYGFRWTLRSQLVKRCAPSTCLSLLSLSTRCCSTRLPWSPQAVCAWQSSSCHEESECSMIRGLQFWSMSRVIRCLSCRIVSRH